MRLFARAVALAALAAVLLVGGSAVGADASSSTAGPRLNPPICC